MKILTNRTSWDTNIKHHIRNGLLYQLPKELVKSIPKSNISRWKNEPENKYKGCEIARFVNAEIELIKRIDENKTLKKANQTYFKLADTFNEIVSKVKGVKKAINNHQDVILETIEEAKESISLNRVLKTFGISRSTFQNYKNKTIASCSFSLFKNCVKKHPFQLLKSEIEIIKEYMHHSVYKYWSKSSVYYKALRDNKIHFSLNTWYKYTNLLGFESGKSQFKKKYDSLITSKPNEFWCADVTVFQTLDGYKHYIHILLDHYSKKVLEYQVMDCPSGITIKNLLQTAYQNLHFKEQINFLTDGGSENVNHTVQDFLNLPHINILQLIAQKDIKFSNSQIEAFNKVLKHQFLYPKEIANREELLITLENDIQIYNSERPQYALKGSTPNETYNSFELNHVQISKNRINQRKIRLETNRKGGCGNC